MTSIDTAYRGDFNGDGYLDVAVCSNHFGSDDAGGVRIFFAASGTPAVSGTVSTSTADVNSDGIDDMIIGANQNDDGASDAGQISLINNLPGSAERYQRTVS